MFLIWTLLFLKVVKLSVGLSPSSLVPTSGPPLLNVPVYSLSTVGADGLATMNILTYCTPVGTDPTTGERRWAIALFKESLSYAHFTQKGANGGKGVLQLLRSQHSPLVRLLGGSSGRHVDKLTESARLGFPWLSMDTLESDIPAPGPLPMLLPGCEHYLELRQEGGLLDAGSHVLALCVVDKQLVEEGGNQQIELMAHSQSEPPLLMTAALRGQGLITEAGRVAQRWEDDDC